MASPSRLRVFEPAGAQVSVFSDQPLAEGNHIIRVKFDYDGGGIGEGATATLVVAEKQAAQGRIERMVGSASPAGGIREQNVVPVCRHPQKILL
jgi:hypothetical protein